MYTEEIARISIERFAEQLRKPEAVLFWEYLDENLSAKEMLWVSTKRDVILSSR
jgi:hypothetical protein